VCSKKVDDFSFSFFLFENFVPFLKRQKRNFLFPFRILFSLSLFSSFLSHTAKSACLPSSTPAKLPSVRPSLIVFENSRRQIFGGSFCGKCAHALQLDLIVPLVYLRVAGGEVPGGSSLAPKIGPLGLVRILPQQITNVIVVAIFTISLHSSPPRRSVMISPRPPRR